jgi:hypothetical protein
MSFLPLSAYVFSLIFSRLRERILQNGFIDNGVVLEVLPPSGAFSWNSLGIEHRPVIVTLC